MIHQIKTFLSKGNRAQWLVFAIFALTIFVKCFLFHWYCFHSVLISSLWHAPYEFLSFWCPKIAVSLFFASFVFFFKRSWWTILFSFILDFWILANLVYFRANAIFLDIFSFSMTSNMDGFWSSVIFYCSWSDSIYFIVTILYALCLLLIPTFNKRAWYYGIGGMIVSYIISLCGIFSMTHRWGENVGVMFYNPISLSMRTTLSSLSYTDHVKDFSIIHSVGFILVDWVENIKAEDSNIDKEALSIQVKPFVQENNSATFDTPLILILVESLEDWGVNETSTPNLCKFLKTHKCLHAHKLTKQTIGGTSADGQMIMNTGLLPISQGAACFRFPTNKYPSIGECCTGKTATILPHQIGIWNQQYMSPAYAYDTTIIRNENDSLLFYTTMDCLHNGYQMIQTITMSSHSPFNYGASKSHLQLQENLPAYMSDYLKSIHYMDEGLQVLLSQIDEDSLLSKATIVITGDHTIFPDDMRAEYAHLCHKNSYNYRIGEAFVPLIIYSPQVQQEIQITDTCYQMDIYPTVMHLIGCEDYYWKGFGVNLLDTSTCANRPVSEKEAFELSDKLIRSNWFGRQDRQTDRQTEETLTL